AAGKGCYRLELRQVAAIDWLIFLCDSIDFPLTHVWRYGIHEPHMNQPRSRAMAQKIAKPPPPYATFPTFVSFLNKLKETVVPPKIDRTLFGNTSGSLIYSIIGSLKSLALIDEDGVPRPPFK